MDGIQDTTPATILVIDDNDTNRYVLASWLRRSGHTVVEAGDAGESAQAERGGGCEDRIGARVGDGEKRSREGEEEREGEGDRRPYGTARLPRGVHPPRAHRRRHRADERGEDRAAEEKQPRGAALAEELQGWIHSARSPATIRSAWSTRRAPARSPAATQAHTTATCLIRPLFMARNLAKAGGAAGADFAAPPAVPRDARFAVCASV